MKKYWEMSVSIEGRRSRNVFMRENGEGLVLIAESDRMSIAMKKPVRPRPALQWTSIGRVIFDSVWGMVLYIVL
ncbi:MAG: hypothetical protein Hyperionvirus21_10 [Hyperionvirus sp.]|uniref:Uncharacterized protein n=1 Tax=Hyperionvirus sp. TaxID=2487770 RepID=A0A3G5AAL7_9VIRU|nr:MAG: hypothetical protein Hyperionvirus21_10 [Hyperionvirus sp.]